MDYMLNSSWRVYGMFAGADKPLNHILRIPPRKRWESTRTFRLANTNTMEGGSATSGNHGDVKNNSPWKPHKQWRRRKRGNVKPGDRVSQWGESRPSIALFFLWQMYYIEQTPATRKFGEDYGARKCGNKPMEQESIVTILFRGHLFLCIGRECLFAYFAQPNHK